MLSPYIASKARHHAFWAGMDPLLQEAGITLSSMCWHGWQWNAEPDKSPPPSAWSKHALDCLEAASACDVLLFYNLKGRQSAIRGRDGGRRCTVTRQDGAPGFTVADVIPASSATLSFV